MSDEPQYTAAGLLSLDDLLRCRSAASRLSGFVDFSPGELQTGFFTHRDGLPEIGGTAAGQVVELDVTGALPLKTPPWETFTETLERGADVGRLGRLSVRCGFEEGNSKQNRRGYDLVGLDVSSDRVSFMYVANGSKVMLNRTYRKEFMGRVVRSLDLPLILKDVEDHFTLSHATGGALWVTGTLGGTNWDPEGFTCEMPGSTGQDVLGRVRHFLESFATAKRFAYEWSAGRDRRGHSTLDTPLSRTIYDVVRTAGLRAQTYEVHAEFRAVDVTAIESIRRLCGPDDEVYTRLCSFDLPEDNAAELTIVTRRTGHSLNLTLALSEGLPFVEEKLGLSFKPAT